MNEDNNNLFVDEEELTGKPTKEDRVLWAICYAHFLFLVPFLLQKDSEFLKFHMKQWWVLYVLFVLVNFISAVFFPINISLRLVWILFLAYTWIGILNWYKAYLGQKNEIWFLKELVAKVGEKMNEKQ
ncbi:MAG: hypothetical protein ACD_3C00086G0052 [uncultured bacterium (gcode 4)]|uniref:Uncharacterized protein n=1 Tax=uncultured bacterium (gcode 4) TaxID=1234023 RepID=K2FZ40_9BACT|nr:MAG: hypothetical protein ACD_3C00086G0052 [uncultured bacterium (gcode 4)]